MSIQPATKPIRQVNDSVYELHMPIGRPSMQVLFFHGLQLGDYEGAHLTTWESSDGSRLWPQTWLVDEFPDAHVFSVSYDARVAKGEGNFDLQIIGENLTSDLVGANIGQEAHCPVILVGHCFGGLVIKKLCLLAHQIVYLKGDATDYSSKLNKFLGNIKGVFYYATPHRGIPLNIGSYFLHEGPLLPLVKTLSTESARLNSEFDDLIRLGPYKNAWRIAGVGESLRTKWDIYHMDFFTTRVIHYLDLVEEVRTCKLCHGVVIACRPILGTLVTRLAGIDLQTREPFKGLQLVLMGTFRGGLTIRRRFCDNLHSLVILQGRYHDVVVPEASARDGERFNVVKADHISISKPENKTSMNFYALTQLLASIALDMKVNLPVHQCQGLPDYPVGLEGRATEIREKLKIHQVLGIVGMGGIGKTTLAKEVFNGISQEFEYTCFVDNVKGVEKIHTLKEWIPHQFCFKGKRVDGEKKKIEWVDLKDKKMLIMMDDVDTEVQLIEALPKLNHFDSGSRVIITTRDQNVLKVYDTHVYEVKPLKVDEGKKLFCEHAFGHEEIPNSLLGMQRLIRDVQTVVTKCNGLPLTLEVIGRHLRGHENDADFWQGTISRLGKARPITGGEVDRVWASLRVSYDALIPEEKEMFTSAATLFFFDWPLERALAAWGTTCGKSGTGWANLVSRCLVKEVSKTKYDYDFQKDVTFKAVWVHEHLRDMAKDLAPSNMESTSDWESTQRIVRALNTNQVKAQTEFLHLGVRYTWGCLNPWNNWNEMKSKLWKNLSERALLFRSLLNMEQLKYMELEGVLLKGSPKKFPRQLSLLRWDGCRDGDYLKFPVSCIEEMENLAVLELERWQTSKAFSKALGKLTNLRVLLLERMESVRFLPEDLGRLSKLKHLELVALSVSKLPESLGSLSSLVTLRIIECENLVILPENFGHLHSLEELVLGKSNQLESLPNTFGHLKALRKLTIYALELQSLPSSFCLLESLRELLIVAPHLVVLPENFGFLCSLEELVLGSRWASWGMLESLPDTFGHLKALRKLTIYALKLQSLPSSFYLLESLRELDIVADNLVILPENFGHLKALRKLTMRQKKLQSLPSSFCLLESLRELCIVAEHLKTFPENLGQLTSLERLDLEVNSVKAPMESLEQLSSLCHLRFQSVTAETLPDSLGQLASLRELQIKCRNLKELPDSLGRLSLLEKFTIDASLASFPEWVGELHSLKSLEIWCGKFEFLPESLGRLSSLQTLKIFYCHKLKSLPDSLRRSSSRQIPIDNESSNRSSDTLRERQLHQCPLLDVSTLKSLGWHIRAHPPVSP